MDPLYFFKLDFEDTRDYQSVREHALDSKGLITISDLLFKHICTYFIVIFLKIIIAPVSVGPYLHSVPRRVPLYQVNEHKKSNTNAKTLAPTPIVDIVPLLNTITVESRTAALSRVVPS